jgi:hypothetical protein
VEKGCNISLDLLIGYIDRSPCLFFNGALHSIAFLGSANSFCPLMSMMRDSVR